MHCNRKKRTNAPGRITWGGIFLLAAAVFVGSLLLGRWLGFKLLASRTGIKNPPMAADSVAPAPQENLGAATPNGNADRRQDISPPSLLVPPPVVEPTPKAVEPPASTSPTDELLAPEKTPKPKPTPTPSGSPTPKVTPTPTPSPTATKSPLLPRPLYIRVQVGAFASQDHANELVDQLAKEGYHGQVEVLKKGSEPYYRVVVGPYKDSEAAHSAADQLNGAGHAAIVLEGDTSSDTDQRNQ